MRKIAECDDDGTLIRQIPFSSSLHCTRAHTNPRTGRRDFKVKLWFERLDQPTATRMGGEGARVLVFPLEAKEAICH